LGRADDAGVGHQGEYQVATRARRHRIATRIVRGGSLRDRRQKCRLDVVQVLGTLAEVALRRGLHPVETVPQVDLVEVHLEDLVLTELLLDLSRQHHLPRFAPQRLLPGEVLRKDVADRKSTRLNSSHVKISYAVFCLKKKNK